jgi:hypothetical protein
MSISDARDHLEQDRTNSHGYVKRDKILNPTTSEGELNTSLTNFSVPIKIQQNR